MSIKISKRTNLCIYFTEQEVSVRMWSIEQSFTRSNSFEYKLCPMGRVYREQDIFIYKLKERCIETTVENIRKRLDCIIKLVHDKPITPLPKKKKSNYFHQFENIQLSTNANLRLPTWFESFYRIIPYNKIELDILCGLHGAILV